MTMPNKTYELRKLYFEQHPCPAKQQELDYQPLIKWPANGYFENFKLDAELLQKAVFPSKSPDHYSIADQVLGTLKNFLNGRRKLVWNNPSNKPLIFS